MLSAQPLPLTLPLDVWFLVFDYFCPEDFTSDLNVLTNTLCSCALTCQSWLPRARYLLYNHVFLDRWTACRLLKRTLKEYPDLGALVGKLDIQVTSYEDEDDSDDSGQEPSAIISVGLLSPFPLDVVGQLINLSELTIISPEDEMVFSHRLVPFIQAFASCRALLHLCLDGIRFPSVRDFLHVIRSFPQVTTLNLWRCIWIINDLRYAEQTQKARTKKKCKNLYRLDVRDAVKLLLTCLCLFMFLISVWHGFPWKLVVLWHRMSYCATLLRSWN